jgi:HD-GYP domain-containing protein (c-di-GMP phosphodiesterase class II)
MSSDDSEVTASPIPFDETACGFLDPIGELDLASRRKLLEKSRRLSLRSGEVLLAKDYPWSMLFLLDGSVELKATERGVGRLIKRGQKAFTSPLFAAHAQRQAMATARSDSQILVFDRRLFELLAEHAMTQPHEAGFFEINTVENTLFQDLMAGYQRGCLAIPGVPKITEILSQQVAKTSADTQRLARLIELDPALTVRLIYATKERGKIPSVATAVAQLGVEQVIEIAREFSLNNICQALRAEVRERLVETYRHSIRVAVYSYLLAKQLSHLDHHYAFMLGLLHDVGMFSILCAADRYLDQMAGVDELDALVWKLHGMVGGLVLQSWGFNPAFIKNSRGG